jgi:small subunit ribosomal protein S5
MNMNQGQGQQRQGNQNHGQRRPHNNGPRRRHDNRERDNEEKLFSEIIELKRVAKVTAGAKRLRFSTVVAVGNRNGKIGIAMGRGMDPQESLQKATKKANESLFTVKMNMEKKTIPHRVEAKYKSSKVLIKPAPVGTGIVAGGSVRKILELAGIENVVSKSLGTNNAITNAYCALLALSKLKAIPHVGRTEKTSKES